MSDRNALLAAIRANPDEDTPRLIFADWLDENEPDAKPRAGKGKQPSPSSWASLIRAQCEFERLRNDGSAAAAVFDFFLKEDEKTLDGVRWERVMPQMCRRVELFRLIHALGRASAKARSAGRPKASPGAAWNDHTHRGFPAEVNVSDGNKWLRRLPEMMAFSPPVQVDFRQIYATPPPDGLAATGFARWCRSLIISATPRHAELVATLSRLPDTAGVRELRCGWAADNRTRQILTSLADSPNWSGLRELVFDASFRVPAELPGQVLRAAHLRGLTRLSITHGEQMGAVVAALEGLTELRELTLTNSDLDDDAAVRIARMPGLANLRLLNLSFNHISGRGASALLASPVLKSLAVLDFEGNQIRGLDRAALANAPAGGLRALNLQSGRLTATDLATVTASPRSSELMYFAACYNPFPESALARLVKGFGNRAPAVLYLMGNNISTAGAQTLADWPAAEQIDMLHLSGNRLSTPGARAIANCAHLRQLNHLCAGVAHSSARAALQKQFGDRADVSVIGS